MLRRLDKELESILIDADMIKDGWQVVCTIREKGIVDIEFIQSANPTKHYQHLWTENNINYCDSKWQFILTMWSDKPLKTMELWNFVKNCQSKISSIIRDLSERQGVFKDDTYDEEIAYLTEIETRKAYYDDISRD